MDKRILVKDQLLDALVQWKEGEWRRLGTI